MSSSFQLRFERLELKFLIDEILARRIASQLPTYCAIDPNCRVTGEGASNGYLIQSLYLDTPALAFHSAKERGDPNRVKLRVRSYTGSPTASIEIKRRRSNVIDKRRFAVRRDQVSRAAAGRLDSKDLVRGDACDLADFAHLVATSGAAPRLTVSYRREAYESLVDHYARVTFDREIRVRPADDWDLTPGPSDWLSFDENWSKRFVSLPVVLELKCETAIPAWMTDLIRVHQLEQSSFSKYSVGIGLTQWRDGAEVRRSRSLRSLA